MMTCDKQITLLIQLTAATLLFATAAAAAQTDEEQLIDIIQAVEQGWENADGTPFRTHFLDFEEARYFESGGQNEGLDDLVENHVEPEGDSLESLALDFSNIRTHVEGDFAWALTDTEITAVVKKDGRKIHNRGHQTFLFRQVDDEWKVVHTHSSSKPVKQEDMQADNGHGEHEH